MIARQGDVLVFSTDSIPQEAVPLKKDLGSVVLAYGEVTGHRHQIKDQEVDLLSSHDTEDRFLRIMNAGGAMLLHEEHDAIFFPPGNYIVRVQREFTSSDMPSVRVED